jgi:hypothetical protein
VLLLAWAGARERRVVRARPRVRACVHACVLWCALVCVRGVGRGVRRQATSQKRRKRRATGAFQAPPPGPTSSSCPLGVSSSCPVGGSAVALAPSVRRRCDWGEQRACGGMATAQRSARRRADGRVLTPATTPIHPRARSPKRSRAQKPQRRARVTGRRAGRPVGQGRGAQRVHSIPASPSSSNDAPPPPLTCVLKALCPRSIIVAVRCRCRCCTGFDEGLGTDLSAFVECGIEMACPGRWSTLEIPGGRVLGAPAPPGHRAQHQWRVPIQRTRPPAPRPPPTPIRPIGSWPFCGGRAAALVGAAADPRRAVDPALVSGGAPANRPQWLLFRPPNSKADQHQADEP